MNTHITILEAIVVSVVSLLGLVAWVFIRTAFEYLVDYVKSK
jgi:hypothetical protein